MKILSGLTGTINSLTSVVIALLGLGIVVALLGGNIPFVGGVADNIVSLVQGLGDAGIVGLVAAIIILNLFNKRKIKLATSLYLLMVICKIP